MSLFPAEHETIAGVGRSLRTGRTTCIEVLNKCLDRIAEWEGRVKAWVVVDRECATKQSIALDRELAEGQCRGPLHGIPFGIKDIINVKDLPTGCGFEPFRNRYPDHDAPLVSALRSSGAVILGKTVTTQFAWIDPPPTRNPWDLTRTPGGSSSGSAVAVALGMCLGALGSQTGGSIIRPASFCGIAGYKPQYKALSDDGIHSLAPSFDHPGLMARSICDVRLIMTELVKHQFDVGEDIGDRLTRTESVGTTRDQPPRLLRPRGLFDRRAEPMMLDRFESTLERLVAAGAEVVEKDDPLDFETILTEHRLIMAAQAFAVHEYSFTWLVDYIDNKTTPEDAQFSGALEQLRHGFAHLSRKDSKCLWAATSAPSISSTTCGGSRPSWSKGSTRSSPPRPSAPRPTRQRRAIPASTAPSATSVGPRLHSRSGFRLKDCPSPSSWPDPNTGVPSRMASSIPPPGAKTSSAMPPEPGAIKP